MRKTKRKNFRLFKSLIFIGLICFVFSAFHGVISQINDYKEDIASVSRQLEQEKKLNKDLRQDKLNMHSEQHYRDIARKTLGLVEPGDKVYINSNDK